MIDRKIFRINFGQLNFEKFFTALVGAYLLFFSTHVLADKDTQALIGGYGTADFAQKQLAAPPADPNIVPVGIAQTLYSTTPTNPLAIMLTQQNLAGYFTINGTPPDQNTVINNIINNVATFGSAGTSIPSTAGIYASCGTSVMTGESSSVNDCVKQKLSPPFINVDLNSLIGPLVYQGQDQDQAAINFISAASVLNNPFPLIDLNKMASDNNTDLPTLLTNNTDVAKYVNDLKAFASMQAVGLSNFYQLYAERTPNKVTQQSNPDLFNALNALNMPKASALQLENYMATRRISDPNWVASLANDSPAALLRQIVVLLAENLFETYNNRLTNERVLSSLTAIQLQQTANLRTLIEQDANKVTNPPANPPAQPTPGQ